MLPYMHRPWKKIIPLYIAYGLPSFPLYKLLGLENSKYMKKFEGKMKKMSDD